MSKAAVDSKQQPAKARSRRRKGLAVICALGASAIGIPAIAAQAHGGDTCSSGLLLNTLIQVGDCVSGGGHDAAPVAPASQQQQQQQGGGGGGGGGASSSSSSSSSSGSSGS